MFLLISNRLPSRTRNYSTGTRVFWFRFWIIPEPPAPVPLDKGNGDCPQISPSATTDSLHMRVYEGVKKKVSEHGNEWVSHVISS